MSGCPPQLDCPAPSLYWGLGVPRTQPPKGNMMTLLENYCLITDALRVPPDAPVENIVRKVEILHEQLATYSKQNAALVEALEGILNINNPPWGEPGHVDFIDAIKMGRQALAPKGMR